MKGFGIYITITPETEERKSSGGVLLNDTQNLRFVKGTVINSAVPELQKGDSVLYDRANSHKTMIDGKSYVIVKAGDIAVIL